ncbi:Uncharacterised protein [Halioglobus japonicus]|nr:Uncharacterised protein [Halioglobus japonicus]
MPIANHIRSIKTLLALLVLACTSSVQAQTPAPPGATTAANASASAPLAESQKTAKALLLRMASELADAKKFQTDIRIGYDTLQEDGQKIEFGEARQLSVERPALVLSDVTTSNGTGESVLFDGKMITIADSTANVYSQVPQPGDIDATINYFLNDLHMRLPLAMMIMNRFPQELEKRMTDIAYVEETDILGELTHHIAGRTKDVDFQAWITTGNQALPLRIILTYRTQPAQPQFWANFSNWNFNPSFAHKTFRFEPPADAREIPLAASFTPEAATGAAPPTAGEQQ